MSGKKLVIAILVVIAAAGFAGCHKRPADFLGGTPGGPIIVIRPEPEPTGTPLEPGRTYQCKDTTKPCWYLGWFDSDHWRNLPEHVRIGVKEKTPAMPYFLNHTAVVTGMEVRLKAGGPRIQVSRIELTLASGVLEIDVPNVNDVPKWSFGGRELGGKLRARTLLSETLLGKITSLKVRKRPNEPVEPEVTMENLEEIRIQYNQ